ncbi:hypothetical protein HK097_001890, partial [Rhizophlyctis rosea]
SGDRQRTNEEIQTPIPLKVGVGSTNDVVLGADGQSVFSAHSSGAVVRWQLSADTNPSPVQMGLFAGDNVSKQSLALSSDGKVVWADGADGGIRAWDVESGKEVKAYQANVGSGVNGGVRTLAFGGEAVFSGGGNGAIQRWNA